MKELYLIPKQGYERMLSSLNTVSVKIKGNTKSKNNREWKTSIPPPSVQNPSTPHIPLRVVKTLENKENRNPSLYELLPMTIKTDEISHAKIILKYFEKTNNISWDNTGDLYAPVNEGNIIDIINDFNSGKTKFTDHKIELYKYIITTTGLPLWMIKNPTIKKMIIPKDIIEVKPESTSPWKNTKNKYGAKSKTNNKNNNNRSWTSY